jgi:Ser/Thr protein kinase RdoA (MazF antagonist)
MGWDASWALHASRHEAVLAASFPSDIRTFGTVPRDFLLDRRFVPPDIRDAWRAIASPGARRRAALLTHQRRRGANAAAPRDCHAGNVLVDRARRRSRPHFVDFDERVHGAGVQDLWMLLSGDRADMSASSASCCRIRRFLRVRLARAPSRRGAAHAAPPPLLGVARAERWDDPAFPAAFPWFNTQRYWQDRILELREQVALMDEPPLGTN